MGGGAMRTAAKVATIGVAAAGGGIRGAGFPSIPAVTGQSMIRSASKPISAAIVSASHSKVDGVAQVQRSSWEVDDWDVIGSGEERVVSEPRGGEPMDRIVFQGAPSLQEAKDATTELKDALDRVYLSNPKSTGYEDSFAAEAGHVSSLRLIPNAYCVESKTSETKVVPVPKHAMQAFALLSESPEAQNVVASIASDPNVWNAVLKNDALLQFLDSQKSSAVLPESESPDTEIKKFEEFSEEIPSGNVMKTLTDLMENIKLTVVEMVTNISSFVQSIFSFPAGDNGYTDTDGKSKSNSHGEKILSASFMGLAVMVVMIVILKRG